MFSTAKLMRVAIRPVNRPTRQANVHFKNMYWSTCVFDLFLQSCLNKSFSFILSILSLKYLKLRPWSREEEKEEEDILIIQALDVRNFGADQSKWCGRKFSISLNKRLVQCVALCVSLFSFFSIVINTSTNMVCNFSHASLSFSLSDKEETGFWSETLQQNCV